MFCSQRVPASLRKDPVLWSECISGALYWNDFLRLARLCGFGDPRLVTSVPVNITNRTLEAVIAQHMPPTSNAKGETVPQFYSATYRLWKIPELEPDCEDYGQAVQYLGTIPFPEVQAAASQGAASVRPLPVGGSGESAQHEALMSSLDVDHDDEGEEIHAQGASSSTSTPSPTTELMTAYRLDDHHFFPAGKVMPVCGNTFRMLHQTRLKPHFRFFGGNFTQHYGIFDGCGKSMPFSAGDSSCGSNGCC